MFISLFALGVPSVAVLLVIDVKYQEREQPAAVYVLSILASKLFALLPITDPIFIIRNRDVLEVISEAKEKITLKKATLRTDTASTKM